MNKKNFTTDLMNLRHQLSHVRKNYQRFWERYLDRFAADAAFHALGETVADDTLNRAIQEAAAARLHARDVRLIGLESREIASAGLVHGACFLNGRFCTFLVSRADRLGLLAMASLEDGHVLYSRFSLAPRTAAAAA